jgi:RNase P/RNase MRP subunit p29
MNINQYDFIGKKIIVKKSKNKAFVGIKSLVVDETKNMIILEDGRKLLKALVELEIIKEK